MDLEKASPPLYALIRGPFGASGYEVATLGRPGTTEPAIVLLFTSRGAAERYGAGKPRGHADWRIGTLATWERLVFFLEHLTSTVEHLCLDSKRDDESEDLAVPIEAVLPGMRERARAEAERT